MALTWEQTIEWIRREPGWSQLVRDAYFDDPVEASAERFFRSTEYAALRALLPQKRGRILDIGAGRGVASYAFARDGWQVVALEPDPSDLVGVGCIQVLAKRTGFSIDISRSAGEQIPFEDNSFDVVYAREVLHHAKDLQALCREACRVLQPGGLFIACREHVVDRRSDCRIFLERHPLHRFYGGENARTLKEYVAAIELGGIKNLRVLNPLETDINLFPESVDSLQKRWVWLRRVVSSLKMRRFLGRLYRKPGRLYSFVGVK